MAQQINLFDPRFAPQRLPFGSRHALLASLGALALALLASLALQWAARDSVLQAQALEQRLGAQRAPVPAKGQAAADQQAEGGAEISALRQLEASQRRLRAALDAGAAGAREGHADYLVALARQASAALWITGFSVSDNGEAITLEGRMAEPSVLADYLRRLNAEPRFKGRPFAQLNLASVEAGVNGAAQGFTEFVLRSRASGEVKP